MSGGKLSVFVTGLALAGVFVCGREARGDGDYAAGYRFSPQGHPKWPAGLLELANLTNRVHGFCCGEQDVFFYSGTAEGLQEFLKKYSTIKGIVQHRVVLQPGKGLAKSPWQKGAGRACDWQIYGYPVSRLPGAQRPSGEAPAKEAYVLEVVVWMGGRIKLSDVEIPKGLEVVVEEKP
jgi:hypothetical protein